MTTVTATAAGPWLQALGRPARPGHAGQTYYLTGPESLTQIQQAGAIGSAIGRPVRFEELPPETFRQYATRRFPAPVVDDLLRGWAQSAGAPPTSHPTSKSSSAAQPPPTPSGPPSTPTPTADPPGHVTPGGFVLCQ